MKAFLLIVTVFLVSCSTIKINDSANDDYYFYFEKTDGDFQAHHIIPWAKRTHPAVQKAAKSGDAFHMNEALNGIPIHTDFHYGSHPNYSNLIQQRLDAIDINQSANEVFNEVVDIINDVRTAVQNNPTTHINQLNF